MAGEQTTVTSAKPQAKPSQQRRLEQDRAAAAWNDITEVTQGDFKDKYSALARGGAADIQMNGLGQTLAFWRAKHGKEHTALYRHVDSWVRGNMQITDSNDLLEWIMQKANTEQYRRATSEAIAFLIWVKRFAEAELG